MSKPLQRSAAPGQSGPSVLPARIEAISLDLDDTLWPVLPTLIGAEKALSDWLASNAPATSRLYTQSNRSRWRRAVLTARADMAHNMSFVRQEMLRLAIEEAGERAGLAQSAFDVFFAARQRVELFDDVVPVLEAWRQRFRLIAISNGNADLDLIGLGHLFSAKVSAHKVGFAKPDARIFAHGCEAAGVEPAATLHIGDDYELDYLAAREAGLHAAWLRRPSLPAGESPAASSGQQAPVPFIGLRAIHDWLAGHE